MWVRVLLVIISLGIVLPTSAAGVTVGEAAPAVSLPNLVSDSPFGSEVSLEGLRGKVVYLDFWASWCGPCRVSFPQLESIRQELGPQGFEVLAVNLDEDESDALSFLADAKVSYPVVRDATGESPARYGLLGMPTGYLIDRHGVVRLVHQGFRKKDGERLRQAITELLAE